MKGVVLTALAVLSNDADAMGGITNDFTHHPFYDRELPCGGYLRRIASLITAPALEEVSRFGGWEQDDQWPYMGAEGGEKPSIVALRFFDASMASWRNYPAADQLPECCKLVAGLCSFVRPTGIANVAVSKLPPGGTIVRHRDAGFPYTDNADVSRFHIVLQGHPNISFECGGQIEHPETGSVWAFQRNAPHSIANRSPVTRIHLMVDLVGAQAPMGTSDEGVHSVQNPSSV